MKYEAKLLSELDSVTSFDVSRVLLHQMQTRLPPLRARVIQQLKLIITQCACPFVCIAGSIISSRERNIE